jgi:putative flavoprotein involved in K+ transport
MWVVATGPDTEPVMPAWPGMAGFPGTIMHAGQFRSAGEMAGREVLVVGPGNSGVDLLKHLARSDAARLWLSARSGMSITPLRLAGIPMHPVSLAGRRLPRRAWACGSSGWTAASAATCTSTGARPGSSRG